MALGMVKGKQASKLALNDDQGMRVIIWKPEKRQVTKETFGRLTTLSQHIHLPPYLLGCDDLNFS